MTQTATATEALTEASARGLNDGWSAANYAEAYGTDAGETLEQQSERRGREGYGLAVEEAEAYIEGFREGVERYWADQWQDGTPRDPEAESAE